jgi:thiol:disulfide interchange protein DsbC
MQQLNNVTIYTFLYPILSQDSQEKSKAIWCAKDRAAAWDNYMVQGKAPSTAPADCKTPLEQNLELGRDFGINGTPTIIFADGGRSGGAMPMEAIEQRLGTAKK